MTAKAKGEKRLKTVLASAVAHPLRSRCLTLLAERVASPAEISRDLSLDLSKVNYHVRSLLEVGLVEEVRTRPVRGALEHFYRAVELPVITSEQESERDPEDRRAFAETTIAIYTANASHAVDTGKSLARPDHHLTRLAFDLDEDGWEEATQAYLALYERIFEIKEAADKRMEDSEGKPIRVVSYQHLFEAADPE
jgi:DNA-binding transcriptional ArsR family regulator